MRNDVVVPVAVPATVPVAAPLATVPAVTSVAPTMTVAAPVVNMPAVVPAVRAVPIQAVSLLDRGHRRLSFCNRCGVNIPFGEAKTYMGLVMCPDCSETEPMPTRSMPVSSY